jgi:hypothetical protein
MLRMSLPVRVAVFTFLFLLTVTTAVFYFTMSDEQAAHWTSWFQPMSDAIGIGVLLLVIPLVCFWIVRLWMDGDSTRFPDVDDAWRAGVKALRKHGYALTDMPLFLVIGPRDEKQARTLMQASRQEFFINGIPEGPAALHWYASRDTDGTVAAYVVCPGTSRVAALSRCGAHPGNTPDTAGKDIFAQSLDASQGTSLGALARGAFAGPGGIGQGQGQAGAGLDDSVDDSPLATPNYGGTMDALGGAVSPTGSPGSLTRPRASVVRLNSTQEDDATERLAYLCRLLRTGRQPYCPLNGILSCLPFELIVHSDDQAEQLQKSLRGDTETLTQHLPIRCPVLCVVSGMEAYTGFRELVRRVGRERATENRFGRGFDIWSRPVPDQLAALAQHACGQFEDWVYTLFREDRELKHHGNPKLYSLLCLIRSHVTERLRRVLVEGFARENQAERALLFGGCYFVATGEKDDQQVFVPSVFARQMELLNELDWQSEVRQRENRFQSLRDVLLLMNAMLLIAIGAIVWFHISV